MLDILLEEPLLFFQIVAIVIISITIHELAHGFAAISQGDDTPIRMGHMTLNPVVHMGWGAIAALCLVGIAWGQMPVNPARFRNYSSSRIIVAAAGPLSNLGLAFVFYLLSDSCVFILNVLNRISAQGAVPIFLYHLLCFAIKLFGLGISMNIILCLFNLIPVPPLDGFHIFKEIFPELHYSLSKSIDTLKYNAAWPFICLFLYFVVMSSFTQFNIIFYALNPFLRAC